MTKADNVSFDNESSDDKDSFVVVVDSLTVCDRVFRVVLGICGFDFGCFDRILCLAEEPWEEHLIWCQRVQDRSTLPKHPRPHSPC